MLDLRTEAKGIAVPGMPFGALGMEVPDAEPTPYDVLAFHASGELTVVESWRGWCAPTPWTSLGS